MRQKRHCHSCSPFFVCVVPLLCLYNTKPTVTRYGQIFEFFKLFLKFFSFYLYVRKTQSEILIILIAEPEIVRQKATAKPTAAFLKRYYKVLFVCFYCADVRSNCHLCNILLNKKCVKQFNCAVAVCVSRRQRNTCKCFYACAVSCDKQSVIKLN